MAATPGVLEMPVISKGNSAMTESNGPCRLLTDQILTKIRQMTYWDALKMDYERPCDWNHGLTDAWGSLPRAPRERREIYRATPDTWGYSHHQQIGYGLGRFFAIWSNGLHHEMHAGQHVRFATSDDGLTWSSDACLAPVPEGNGDIFQAAALYGCDEYVVAYCNRFTGSDSVAAIRKKGGAAPFGLEAFVTTDGSTWEGRGVLADNLAMHEGPRPTLAGRLLATADRRSREPLALVFDDGPLASPKVVELPLPAPGHPLHECSWYEADDGVMRMLFRDETGSLRLWLAESLDGAETWSVPRMTDFVDSMSKVFAGRLPDGRVFVINNAYPQALNRDRLMLSLSDDGKLFHRMFILDDTPSRIRILGRLKGRGHQYPHAIVRDGKLFATYSVSKEDIVVSVVDLAALA